MEKAFKFEWARPDASSPGGEKRVYLIAVAETLEAAKAQIKDKTGSLVGVTLMASGPEVLAEAKNLNVIYGDARFL